MTFADGLLFSSGLMGGVGLTLFILLLTAILIEEYK